MNTAALIAIGAPLTAAGGGMYTLAATRKNDTGYWIQVTNGDCDLDNKTTETAANADFSGEANTQAVVAELGNGTAYAAKLCADLVYNGCDDWYLPAAGELNAMYQQLGPSGNNGFVTDAYWSSSEGGLYTAWNQYFDIGDQYGRSGKAVPVRCRCVRR